MVKNLAEILQERLGLSEEISMQAAQIAIAFVKDKLPDSVAPHFDTLAAADSIGDVVSGALGGSLGGALGGMFGGGDD